MATLVPSSGPPAIPYTAGVSENIRRGMLEVWHKGGFQVQPFPPLNVDQGEECSVGGEAGQCGVPDSLLLWQSLHWRDQVETGNQTEGASICMPNPVSAEVCGCGARLGKPPSHQLEGHIDDQLGQVT